MADGPSTLILTDIDSVSRHLDEFAWEPMCPGVEICRLFTDERGTTKMALLRYAPGATVEEHLHLGMEYIQILSGSQQDARGTYTAGSLLVSPPGSRHSVVSPEGCVVLAIWECPVQFL